MTFESATKSRLAAEVGTTATGHFVQTLENRREPPPLVPPSIWRVELSQQLSSMTPEELCGGAVAEVEAGRSVKSGLLLWNDDLESSHTVSQNIRTVTGSYWHGIMHRREPDYGNAAYWFERVGEHGIFPDLKMAATAVAAQLGLDDWQVKVASSHEWNPVAFIGWCEDAATGRLSDTQVKFLRLVQVEEIRLLLSYSFREALKRP